MTWWGWLVFALAVVGGLTLIVWGGIMESRHVEAELNLARRKRHGAIRMLGSALRRDTPAFTSHPTTEPLSMCIGCGSTDGTHVDRLGRPCPYKS